MSSTQAPRNRSRSAAPRGNGRAAPNANVRSRAASPASPRAAATKSGAGATILASLLGFAATASVAGLIAWSSGCHSEAPPGASADAPSRVTQLPAPEPTEAPKAPPKTEEEEQATADDDAGATEAAEPEKPYTGPLLGAMAVQTPVYAKMEFSNKRVGYIRLGSKVPVDPTPVKSGKCTQGWYHLLDGGYVCGKYATLDMNNPQVRLGITPPNLDEVLPYKYAYNTAHGTPLYRSVPSTEEMVHYEPYLDAAKKARRKAEREEEAKARDAKKANDEKDVYEASAKSKTVPDAGAPTIEMAAEVAAEAADRAGALAAAAAIGILDGGAPSGNEEVDPEADKPWWQRKPAEGKSVNVTLADLEQDSDGTIAKRMVKGFFIAVDKTFGWNKRQWYKSTSGLVAPADRMYINKPPESQGMVVPEGVTQIGFITSSKASKYELDDEGKNLKKLGKIARFSAFGLTGESKSHKTIVYRKTTEGWWMKAIDGTYTEPGPPPADLAPGEKWIDVNLTRKTLLAMEGDKPVYAALHSPGKTSKVKKKNHATIKGTFRIREKHITATMDGDGAAGDLPYSIEDVPYVSYFEGSYALHGAFWHSNFGREMSHGCVNLSPLDAKHMFFWAGPTLPRGWHGVWATKDNPGTIVVVHD